MNTSSTNSEDQDNTKCAGSQYWTFEGSSVGLPTLEDVGPQVVAQLIIISKTCGGQGVFEQFECSVAEPLLPFNQSSLAESTAFLKITSNTESDFIHIAHVHLIPWGISFCEQT